MNVGIRDSGVGFQNSDAEPPEPSVWVLDCGVGFRKSAIEVSGLRHFTRKWI